MVSLVKHPPVSRGAQVQGFFFTDRTAMIAAPHPSTGTRFMELPLETVALFALKLAYETEGSSPILRDDLVMADYEREVFALLVRKGDIAAIQAKLDACLGLAMNALGGTDKPMGRELGRLSLDVQSACTLEQLNAPLLTLRDYLKDIL